MKKMQCSFFDNIWQVKKKIQGERKNCGGREKIDPSWQMWREGTGEDGEKKEMALLSAVNGSSK